MPMASQASSVADGVFSMPQTIGLTMRTFTAYIVPPVVCQYLMGVLVQLEGTLTYRMALLPVVLYLAWRATFVDMSGGDLSKAKMNTALNTQMCVVVARCAVWAFARARYWCYKTVDYQTKSDVGSVYTACWDAWDLLLNQRGVGWSWHRGRVIPKPMFATNSRVIFVLSMALGFAVHALALDACAQTIRMFSPDTFGSLKGGSLFDHTLPPVLEVLRAMVISLLTAASAYFGIQYAYHFLAIIFVTVFRQHPSQWPPLFDNPFISTSLSELWGHRWHQLMRDTVLNLGNRPCSFLFGRLGGLLGAFVVSGIFHNLDLGQRGHSFVCLGFWVMNGVGVILEYLWKKVTGRSVGGIWGWVWTAAWLFLWGIPMVNSYAEVGRLSGLGLGGGFEPSLVLLALVRRVFTSST